MSLFDLRLPGLPLPIVGTPTPIRAADPLISINPLELNQQHNEIDKDEQDGSLRSRFARESGRDGFPDPIGYNGGSGFDGGDPFNSGAADGWQGRGGYQSGTGDHPTYAAAHAESMSDGLLPQVFGGLRDTLGGVLSPPGTSTGPEVDLPSQQPNSPSQSGSTPPGADRGLPTSPLPLPRAAPDYATQISQQTTLLSQANLLSQLSTQPALVSTQSAPVSTQSAPAQTQPSLPASTLSQAALGNTPLSTSSAPLATASTQTATLPSTPLAATVRQDAQPVPSARTGEAATVQTRADAVSTAGDRANNTVLSPSLQTQQNVAALAAVRAEAQAPTALAQAAHTTQATVAAAQANPMANPMANVPQARGADTPAQLPGTGLPAGHTAEGTQRLRDQRLSAMTRMASALQRLRMRRREYQSPYAGQPFRQPGERNPGTQWLTWIIVILAYGMLAAGVVMFVPADGHSDWIDFVTQSPSQGVALAILALVAVGGTVLLARQFMLQRRQH